MRNAGEFRCPIIVCIAIFGGSGGGVWLVFCLECWRVAGCVLQWRKLACSRRVLMVSVGVGRLLNLVCVDELMAMFWQHLVILEAPDPHGGPFRVFMGPSQSRVCGCSLVHGVFMSM
jgi:hypothetical protein